MKFDSEAQQKLVLDIVKSARITVDVNTLQEVVVTFDDLVKAITDAEVEVPHP